MHRGSGKPFKDKNKLAYCFLKGFNHNPLSDFSHNPVDPVNPVRKMFFLFVFLPAVPLAGSSFRLPSGMFTPLNPQAIQLGPLYFLFHRGDKSSVSCLPREMLNSFISLGYSVYCLLFLSLVLISGCDPGNSEHKT